MKVFVSYKQHAAARALVLAQTRALAQAEAIQLLEWHLSTTMTQLRPDGADVCMHLVEYGRTLGETDRAGYLTIALAMQLYRTFASSLLHRRYAADIRSFIRTGEITESIIVAARKGSRGLRRREALNYRLHLLSQALSQLLFTPRKPPEHFVVEQLR